MNIQSYHQIQERLQEKNITLVAVSKTKPVEDIKILYDEGQRIFGENRAKELQMKHEELPKDIEWHMIGHMQSNKVKYIAPFVHLIHSVDSFSLLEEINKRAAQHERVIEVLLQVHIAEEQTKYGFSAAEIINFVESKKLESLQNICVRGLMGMATFTDEEDQVRKEFQTLKIIFDELKATAFHSDSFDILSMGMSGDYELAITEGSTMVRIGSLIFGSR